MSLTGGTMLIQDYGQFSPERLTEFLGLQTLFLMPGCASATPGSPYWVSDALQINNGEASNTGSHSVGDAWVYWSMYIMKGTYKVGLLSIMDTNRGKLNIELGDGTQVLAQFDEYSSGKLNNYLQTTNCTVTTSGFYDVWVIVRTKNAASSDHVVGFTYIFLTKTS